MYKLYNYSKSYTSDLDHIIRQVNDNWDVKKVRKGKLFWYSFGLKEHDVLRQGWKIHVSLQATNAQEIINVIQFLLEEEVHFKVPGNLETICYINSGDSGDSQTGKIFTIYPSGNDRLVELIKKLDVLIPYSQAPTPPSDLLVRADGAISIRFGVFHSDIICYDENDMPHFGLKKPNQEIVPDQRRLDGLPPQWVIKPNIKLLPPKKAVDISPIQNYLPMALIHKRNHSQVFLGIDNRSFQNVIIKKTKLRTGVDLNTFNGKDRLTNEFTILKKLAHKTNIVPRPIKKIENDDSFIIVMEDLGGTTFNLLPKYSQIKYLKSFISAIVQLHRLGYVHRDIKLSNAILVNEEVKLIDFELSCPVGKEMFILGGTKNFIPPERDFCKAHLRYDSFAIGSCLIHIALGKEPGNLPQKSGQRLGLLHLLGYHKVAKLVKKCCATTIEERLTSEEILQEISQLDTSDFYPNRSNTTIKKQNDTRWYSNAIYTASLATRNYRIHKKDMVCWRNEHNTSNFICEGINTGAAGIVLGLIAASSALRNKNLFKDDILGATQWLISRGRHTIPNGLFTGSAGIALVLGLVGKLYDKNELLITAATFLKKVISENTKTDLFSGLAGAIYSACALYELYNDALFLTIAKPAVQKLTTSVFKFKEEGVVLWPSFLTKELTDQNPSIGAAHGSAGIALSLGWYGQLAKEKDIEELAITTCKSIYTYGRDETQKAVLLDAKSKKTTSNSIWCHGAAGYLWCLLQVPNSIEALEEEIHWSATMFFDSGIIDNPTYCHGLSGQLELCRLLKNIKKYKKKAEDRIIIIKTVLRHIHQKKDGKVLWYSENPNIITPDLWTGFLGPVASLALSEMDSKSSLLSLKWFNNELV